MQIVGELGHVAISLDQRVAEFQRVRGSKADAFEAVDFGEGPDQQAQIRNFAFTLAFNRRDGPAISVDVLAQQVHFAHALGGKLGHFDQHILERAADFFAARVRHHAEAAVLRAAFHDRDERGGAVGAGFGQAVELFDLGKADVDLRQAGLALGAQQVGQAVQGLRAEHQVDVGRALDDGRAFLAGDAAADADHYRALAIFELAPAAELAEDFLLRFFADRARIDQDHVRFFDDRGQDHAFLGA